MRKNTTKKTFENALGKNVKKCISKMWKNVKECAKIAKQEITGLNTFPNLNLKMHSVWTYWHESLNIDICLCGILKFHILYGLKLDFKENLKKKLYLEKMGRMGLRNRNFSTAFCSHFNVKKCENMWKKNTFEQPVGKVELGFFGVQFCCSYFAACPTSAGWKSERSSSNGSEVDCADRRSV